MADKNACVSLTPYLQNPCQLISMKVGCFATCFILMICGVVCILLINEGVNNFHFYDIFISLMIRKPA